MLEDIFNNYKEKECKEQLGQIMEFLEANSALYETRNLDALYNKLKTDGFYFDSEVSSFLTYALQEGYGESIDELLQHLSEEIPEDFCCNRLDVKDVIMPSSIKSIGDRAFFCCELLENINIPNSVTNIGCDAFYSCNELAASGTIYNNALYLGNSENPYLLLLGAKDTSITSCALNEKCKFIHSNAFSYCKELINVTIPNSVMSIADYAFAECEKLKNIIYEGTRAEWDAITKGPDWHKFTYPIKLHCTDGNVEIR